MPSEYPIIGAQAFIDAIQALIQSFNKLIKTKDKKLSTQYKSEIKKKLALIDHYLAHPNLVQRASYLGGLEKIKAQYADDLFRIRIYLAEARILTKAEAKKVNQPLSVLAQHIKARRAYTELYQGEKFQKAGLGKFNDKRPITQPNPIAKQSAKNIGQLKAELNKRKGVKYTAFGLRKDEVKLFETLLNLPYRLQHATNHYYETLNAGSLSSYKELKNQQPEYESPFSTKGNVKKLGNDRFVFFRLFVDPINNTQTRYGDTSLLFDINLLRECGWVSLHDQLNSFPATSVNTRHFYQGNRLLRTSVAVPIKNKTVDKGLHDGLQYRYRQDKFNVTGKKDTLKSFGDTIKVQERQVSFLAEIFYGKDILLGIALSVIRELWYLNASGFRSHFLKQFNAADEDERVELLGELIKGFYRIEGKYPVKLKLEADLEHKTQTFKPIAKTDSLQLDDRIFAVLNPDGDGRYLMDMTTDKEAVKLAENKETKKSLTERLSVARRQRKRFEDIKGREKSYKQWNKEVKVVSEKLLEASNFLDNKTIERSQLIKYFSKKYDIAIVKFEKISNSKLNFIKENYDDLLKKELLELDTLLALTTNVLILLANEDFKNLVIYDIVEFEKLVECNLLQLEWMQKIFANNARFYNLLMDKAVAFTELAELSSEELEQLQDKISDKDVLKQLKKGGVALVDLINEGQIKSAAVS